MADRDAICSACGKRVLISEFADLSAMAFRECGGVLKWEDAAAIFAKPRNRSTAASALSKA